MAFWNKKKRPTPPIPPTEELEKELKRSRYVSRYSRTLKSTIYTLIVVAAFAILVVTLWMPVLQIYGKSMTPTLDNGNIVVTLKTGDLQTGDVVAFYYNNKILVKRVIAGPGQWVDMDEDGVVSVDGVVLDEPYVSELAYGDTNITFPYQVPDGRWFVMGDHRSVSVDSRNSTVGPVSEEQIVGKLVFNVWPLNQIGVIS